MVILHESHVSIVILFTGLSAMNNLKQLEYLARLHVMIATVYSEHDERSLQHFIASFGYVMLIWKVTAITNSLHSSSLIRLHPQNLYSIIAKESRTVSLSYNYVHAVCIKGNSS